MVVSSNREKSRSKVSTHSFPIFLRPYPSSFSAYSLLNFQASKEPNVLRSDTGETLNRQISSLSSLMTVLVSLFTPADIETYKLCPSDVSRHYGDGIRGFAGWQGRKDGMRCAEVRSENTESKRTNQRDCHFICNCN